MADRVLIVDDHDGFRAQASALLRCEGYDVVGDAASAEAAIPLIDRLAPDVVLLDIQLPGADGFELARRLRATHDGGSPAVVLISSREAAAYGPRITESGARGFIAKDDLSGQGLKEILAGS